MVESLLGKTITSITITTIATVTTVTITTILTNELSNAFGQGPGAVWWDVPRVPPGAESDTVGVLGKMTVSDSLVGWVSGWVGAGRKGGGDMELG